VFNVEFRDPPQAQKDYEDRSNQFLGFDILGYLRPILLVASLVRPEKSAATWEPHSHTLEPI